MRKIKVMKWDAIDVKGNKSDEDTVMVLHLLINAKNAKNPDDMPRGLDKFRLFNRLALAFDKANETGELVLEEAEYNFNWRDEKKRRSEAYKYSEN